MPVIAVNLSEKVVQEIQILVEKGLYENLECLIEIGAINQLALERGITPSQIIERGHRSKVPVQQKKDPTKPATQPPKTPKPGIKKQEKMGKKKIKVLESEPVTENDASLLFRRLEKPLRGETPTPFEMPFPPEPGERIFGQVNRLFPLKFICRWLANNAKTERQWPKFTVISSSIADDSGTLGSLLDQWNQKQKRERGCEMATALPRRKNNASLDRFLSQFIARITRSSDIALGAICQYGLARFEDSCIILTNQGLDFAELNNPILDTQNETATSTLSDDEADFLFNHIRKWVPTESADMRTVLMAVKSGKATPTDVSETVRPDLPEDWSDSMVQTHVSGVIARLCDIRLIQRTWQGRNVLYGLGDGMQVGNFLQF